MKVLLSVQITSSSYEAIINVGISMFWYFLLLLPIRTRVDVFTWPPRQKQTPSRDSHYALFFNLELTAIFYYFSVLQIKPHALLHNLLFITMWMIQFKYVYFIHKFGQAVCYCVLDLPTNNIKVIRDAKFSYTVG